jgi:hypothetical protein
LVVIGALLLVAALAVWTLAPSVLVQTLKAPWQLADPLPGVSYVRIDPESSIFRREFDEAAARATTVIRIQMNLWPADCSSGDDWLAEPLVSYTPSSVTITMQARPEFKFASCAGWYDFYGLPLEVHLSEPLAGRPLFDGSGIPTSARPYP